MRFTQADVESYYMHRLDSWRIRHSKGIEFRAKCPFHGGDNATALKLFFDDGHYICFACQAKGNGIDKFEMAMLKLELGYVPEYGMVISSIEKILGTPVVKRIYPEDLDVAKPKGFWNREHARAKYQYQDEFGDELFTVYRFIDRNGKKKTPQDHPCKHSDAEACDKCENGRVPGVDGIRRVIYRLPDVMQSILVFIVEGEKNADDLNRALGTYLKKAGGFQFAKMVLDRIAVTTNMGGAMAWEKKHGYGKYFFGRVVVKLEDNDASGREHTRSVLEDIGPYAKKIYTLDLPVGEGEDISDYLEDHTAEQFLKLLGESYVEHVVPAKKEPVMKGEVAPRQILVRPSELVTKHRDGGDYLVPKLIRKGSRGLVIAEPKTGKSLFFLDIALAIANCQSVLGLPSHMAPVKVGIISREDGPEMVQERLYCLAQGRNLSILDVDRHIRVNTAAQSSRFQIDNDDDLKEMARWLRAEEIEFAVIDVLNRLHGGDENSNNDMSKVMQRFDLLQEMSGAQICVIHHSNAKGKGRGASSIDGWADYIFRLEADEEDPSIKILSVRTKATGNIPPKRVKYWQSDDLKTSRITLVVAR